MPARGNDAGQGGGTGRGSSRPASDPLADFQRWLMKAGARSLGRDVADRVRSTVTGGKRGSSSDVWETATTEPPPDEAAGVRVVPDLPGGPPLP